MRGPSIELPLWNRGSWPSQDVVGESNYLPAIRRLFPTRLSESGNNYAGTAHLRPEPHNRHDRNAVAVVCEGETIGYLPREIAADYSPMLLRLVERGWQPTCPVTVWGHEFTDWEYDRKGREVAHKRFAGSVRVVLDAPHLCIPLNMPPEGAHAMLPFGSSVQLKGEDDRMSAIRPFLTAEGEAWTHATLHAVSEQLARTTRDIVEVRIDGQPVGVLTPAMSKNYLPVIRSLGDAGLLTAARAFVKGNTLQAEVVLHATKAHELPPNWLEEHAGHLRGSSPGTEQAAVTLPATEPDPSVGAMSSHQHEPIPPRPTRIVFNPPPGWPAANGAEPPEGWIPPMDWPPAPAGWRYWIAE